MSSARTTRPDAWRLQTPTRELRGKHVILIASSFTRPLTEALVGGATDVLRHYGVLPRNVRVLWVPGAFELPVVAARLAAARPRPDAIIALGTLIRGQTLQYEVLAHAVAQGLAQVSVSTAVPVTFGVIVAKTLAQAKVRAGLPAAPKRNQRIAAQAGGRIVNRGEEAALAAVAVLRLFERLHTARPKGRRLTNGRLARPLAIARAQDVSS